MVRPALRRRRYRHSATLGQGRLVITSTHAHATTIAILATTLSKRTRSNIDAPIGRLGGGATRLAVIAVALVTIGCSKKYTEIEVRDPGRVGVGLLSTRGFEPVLPPDGSQRVVPLAALPGVAIMRRGGEVAIGWGGQPVTLIDQRGVFPRVTPGSGVEVRGQTLWATYNVTPTRVFPQTVHPEDALPVVLMTDMANVVDAREVKQVRHWPAYVCLPAGVLLAVLGTALLTSSESGSKIGGGLYVAGSIPLLVYSAINLTSSNETKPLAIPGAPPP